MRDRDIVYGQVAPPHNTYQAPGVKSAHGSYDVVGGRLVR